MGLHNSIIKPYDVLIIDEINLRYKRLTKLPEWVSECVNLKKLNCSNNKLVSLPDNLPNNLTELNCADNFIKYLPDIDLPPNLLELYCNNNQLISLYIKVYQN